MKISRISLHLLILAWVFTVLAIFFGQTSNQIKVNEVAKQELLRRSQVQEYFEKTGEKVPSFSCSHCYDDTDSLNYADYLVIVLFVLTASTVVAAIWLWKRK